MSAGLFQAAVDYYRKGNFPEAERLCRGALSEGANPSSCHALIGKIKFALGKMSEAAVELQTALAADPSDPRIHYMLGNALRSTGDLRGASRSYRKAVDSDSAFFEAWCNCGAAYLALGDAATACTYLHRACALQPDSLQALANYGSALWESDNAHRAAQILESARTIAPDNPDIINTLGKARQSLGALGDAETCYRRAIALCPGHGDALYNCANLCRADGRLDEAIELFQAAVRVMPRNIEAVNNLAETYLVRGNVTDAQQWYRQALETDPSHPALFSGLLVCRCYDHGCDAYELFREHRGFDRLFARTARPPRHISARRSRMRIGFVSPDFRRHPVGSFLEPLFTNRNHNEFEYIGLSDVSKPDSVTVKFEGLLDEWRECAGLSHEAFCRQVQADGIDVLVECAGHSAGNRLPALGLRAAPIQISWLGYPHSTGLSQIDYRISDATADPHGNERWYSEKLVRLPGCFCCFAPPSDAPAVSDLPAARNGYITFGSLHHLARLNPDVLHLWAQVLHALPRSRLIIVRNTLTPQKKCELAKAFSRLGIEPRRIEMHDDVRGAGHHLAWYHRCDLALDTRPWSGHTTACEALWMGVPVLTLPGMRFSSRMVASVLTAAGFTEWIAPDSDGIIAGAREFSRNIEILIRIRHSMRDRLKKSTLCNGALFAKHFHQALRDIISRHLQDRR